MILRQKERPSPLKGRGGILPGGRFKNANQFLDFSESDTSNVTISSSVTSLVISKRQVLSYLLVFNDTMTQIYTTHTYEKTKLLFIYYYYYYYTLWR